MFMPLSVPYIIKHHTVMHSWAQRKLSPLCPLNPLNILLAINGPLLSLGFNGLNN